MYRYIRSRALRLKRIFLGRKHLKTAILLFLLLETLLSYAIINRVKYTKIDWDAYMQQIELVLNGERDYENISGETGPLVYPAGFVWIYAILYHFTSKGTDILSAQYIFMGLYLITLSLVVYLYAKNENIPLVMILALGASKRIHSIYMLRLFNDPFAVLFAFIGTFFMVHEHVLLSSVFFSLGISTKMNILLWMPGFVYILYRNHGIKKILTSGVVIGLIQIILGFPFLSKYPYQYLVGAFDFKRQFMYKWTVNWKLISETTFLSSGFATSLLLLHLGLLFVFYSFVWERNTKAHPKPDKPGVNIRSLLSVDEKMLILFTSNFVGIVCARSLHYQFYSWYYFTLPYILSHIKWPKMVSLAFLLMIEYSWNVYPSTQKSSGILLLCHGAIILGLLFYRTNK